MNSLAVRCPHVSPPSLLQHQWSEKEREGDDERPYVEAGALPLSSRATVGQIAEMIIVAMHWRFLPRHHIGCD